MITIEGNKIWQYRINYAGSVIEKTEYTYDFEMESRKENKTEYYDVNDIIDKDTNTVTLELLDNTYISISEI